MSLRFELSGMYKQILLITIATFFFNVNGYSEGSSSEVLLMEQFILDAGSICNVRPSAECIDIGWEYIDSNTDGKLTYRKSSYQKILCQIGLFGERHLSVRVSVTLSQSVYGL